MIDNKEILSIKKVVKELADYVMLNSVATDSTSLYYGRAGMSICLFETSRFLNDEYIEDYAFKLLQQSLLNEKNDIRFDAGLSGIGYALAYLIRNDFIDADFFDVFHTQHNIIVDEFLRQRYDDMVLKDLVIQWQSLLYFYYIPDERLTLKAMELHDICIEKFRTEWNAMRKNTTTTDKEFIFSLWKMYLRVLPFLNQQYPCQHIKEYIGLLKDGIIKRDIQPLYYISAIYLKKYDSFFSTDRIEYNISDFYLIDSLNVKDMFCLPYEFKENVQNSIRKMFDNISIEELEKNITRQLGFSSNSAGLSFGVSGLILGLICIVTKNRHIINEIMPII